MNIFPIAKPVAVKRDDAGNWRHPEMPIFIQGDAQGFDSWARLQGFEVHTANERLLGDDFLEWTPEPPEGDGWFDLAIEKRGNIASWTWARRVAP